MSSPRSRLRPRRCESIKSASASAIAFSFCCTARSERVWLFCSSATNRNVTIVVTVLMISCHVSTALKTKYDGNQTTMRMTQNAKNGARETTPLACSANRSKRPRSGVTSLGRLPSSVTPLGCPFSHSLSGLGGARGAGALVSLGVEPGHVDDAAGEQAELVAHDCLADG